MGHAVAQTAGYPVFRPYAKVWELRHSLDRLLRTFPVRTCTTNVFHKAQLTGRPCLFASIGKCSAPCVNRIEADEHRRLCEQLVGVMTGRLGRPYIAQLTRDMKEASAELEFEKAARLRDQIQMLETVVQQNAVVFDQDVDADVFGFASDELEASVHAFYVRAGSIRGERNWSVERVEDIDDADLMADLLVQVYSDAAGDNHPQSAATISTNREAIGSTQTITPRTLWHAPRPPENATPVRRPPARGPAGTHRTGTARNHRARRTGPP